MLDGASASSKRVQGSEPTAQQRKGFCIRCVWFMGVCVWVGVGVRAFGRKCLALDRGRGWHWWLMGCCAGIVVRCVWLMGLGVGSWLGLALVGCWVYDVGSGLGLRFLGVKCLALGRAWHWRLLGCCGGIVVRCVWLMGVGIGPGLWLALVGVRVFGWKGVGSLGIDVVTRSPVAVQVQVWTFGMALALLDIRSASRQPKALR